MKGMLKRFWRRLRKSHPDVADALKEYCSKKGVTVDDVIAAAVATYLAADTEGKEELEKQFAQRRMFQAGQINIQQTLSILKEAMKAVTDMMSAVQDASWGLVRKSVVNEFKNMVQTVEEVKRMGEERGGIAGNLADQFISAVLARMLTGGSPLDLAEAGKKKPIKRTGEAEVEEVK